MNIPFLDVGSATAELRVGIDDAIKRVLYSGSYILGDEVKAFESEFASYCDSEDSIGVASGLDALYLTLKAMDIGPGDEVIVPAHTFIATWLAVSNCGAVPIGVDINDGDFNISAENIEKAITSKTKAIVPVHMYGHPANIAPILELAVSYSLRVIEDAAQAHGSTYNGRKIGAHSDAVAWSFYPGKNLGALGDGGCVTTNDGALGDRIRLLRNYGSKEKYSHEVKGVNSRLDELQASVLRVKLQVLDEWNTRRADVAQYYNQALSGLNLTLPQTEGWATSAWHLYVVSSDRRDEVVSHLNDNGVGCQVHYPRPPHLQPAYANSGNKVGKFPMAESLTERIFSLPIGPHLTAAQQQRVVDVLCDCKAAY